MDDRQSDGRDTIASAPRERRSNPDEFDIQPGNPVQTRDFGEIGVVSEVRAAHFRVDVPHARDYWLSKATVAAVHDGVVQLEFDKDQLDDLKLEEPTVRSESPVIDASLEAPPPQVDR